MGAMNRTGLVLLTAFGLMMAATLGVRGQEIAAGDAGIEEKLGAQVALDVILKDEDGKDVTLRQLIDKPTILTLNYFSCSGICTPLLNGLADVINQISIEPGRDFQVITVSFDPKDTPAIAHQKRISYLNQMKRAFPPQAWHFLTGDAASTRAVTDSVGFHFRADGEQFVHPGAIMMLSAQGKVSRYMYGISFLPAEITLAVQEAAGGRVSPSVSKVLAFCYSYDPAGRRYVFSITRAGGAVILAFAGIFGIYLIWQGRSRKKARLSE